MGNCWRLTRVGDQCGVNIYRVLGRDIVHRRKIQLKEDIEQMMKAKGQTCAKILEKQRRISCFESDSSTHTQMHMSNKEDMSPMKAEERKECRVSVIRTKKRGLIQIRKKY
ncbi:hypothetical protein CFOL_v3_27180 [Cephalotus follicularis]|uniref:Uncharacterized protein n=1 Tax=Cephalotus follicularis TaxID=3775 RepID=A0A1Q3CU11_CEPFO|nr:hypothetical protein CFOL_v3_27180 [Cephalotus follicularis]